MHFLIAALTFAAVWAWAVAHQAVLFWIFAAAVDQLPAPQTANSFYAWFFGVLQFLAANITRGAKGTQATLAKK